MFIPILLLLTMQADVLRPDLPPRGSSVNGTFDMPTAVKNHYSGGIPLFGDLVFPDDAKQKVADVELYNSTTGQLVEKVTTATAKFEFPSVPLGMYSINVISQGFVAERKEINLNAENSDTFTKVDMTIHLYRKPGATKEADTVIDAAKANLPIAKDALKEFDKAVEEESKNDPNKAIPHLEKALKISPYYFDANLKLGLDYQQNGNADGAMTLLVRAMELNPSSSAARLALGELYFEKEQFQEAVDQLEAGMKVGPANAEAYYAIGTSFFKLGNLQDAEVNLKQSLAISEEKMGKAHLELYNVYLKSSRNDAALAELTTYLEKYPDASDRQVVQALADKLKRQKTP